MKKSVSRYISSILVEAKRLFTLSWTVCGSFWWIGSLLISILTHTGEITVN